jgi:hypothetical protein
MSEIQGGKYSRSTTTATIKTGAGVVYGVIINSHSSGTFKIHDGTSASGEIIANTFTLPSGSQVITFPEAIEFYTGLHIVYGGTLDATWIIR